MVATSERLFVHVETRRRHQAVGDVAAGACLRVLRGACVDAAAAAHFVTAASGAPFRRISSTRTKRCWRQPLIDPRVVAAVHRAVHHVAWLHLLSNMLFLVIFGLPAERALGAATIPLAVRRSAGISPT